MDAVQLMISKLKDGIIRIKEIYTFVLQNFLPSITGEKISDGFEFF